MATPPSLLALDDVSKTFGAVRAVSGVSLDVPTGGFIGILGPNGAGKSTLFDVLSGHAAPSAGEVRLDGRRVNGRSATFFAREGVGRTFQIPKLLDGRDVLDNVALGSVGPQASWRLVASFGLRRARAKASEALALVGIEKASARAARSLNAGERRLVEIARVLAGSARVILLDEPTVGLADDDERRLARLLRSLHASGLTIVVVSHNVPFLLSLVEDVVVMNVGTVLMHGEPEEVRKSKAVREAYLGED